VFREAFEAAYRQLYGRSIEGVAIEVLSWTLSIAAPAPEPSRPPAEAPAAPGPPEPEGHQTLWDPACAERLRAPVYRRESLPPGSRISGPALIAEDQTTTVVGAAFEARIDGLRNIVLRRRQENRDE
jgi:N-methylhydantoinase A